MYSIYAYMFPRSVPCIFPCVFLNLWSQQKTSKNERCKISKLKVFPLVCSKYLSSWTGPDMTEVRVLVQFRTLRLQNLLFDVIS